MNTAYKIIIYLASLLALNFVLLSRVSAQSPNPPNTEIGNIITNSQHQGIKYKFNPATSKPQPLKTFSSYGPTGMEKEVMGFALTGTYQVEHIQVTYTLTLRLLHTSE